LFVTECSLNTFHITLERPNVTESSRAYQLYGVSLMKVFEELTAKGCYISNIFNYLWAILSTGHKTFNHQQIMWHYINSPVFFWLKTKKIWITFNVHTFLCY